MSARRLRGFTLVELLVVITIIVVLLSLLAPAMDKAIDAAVKAKCAAQQRSLTQIWTDYAMNSRNRYLSGLRGDGATEHTPYFNTAAMELVESYAGNVNKANSAGGAWGGLPPIVIDPSFSQNMGLKDGAYGWWIGYNSLSGLPFVSRANNGVSPWPRWRSPLGLNQAGDGQMWVCHNTWETSGYLAMVAHTAEGGPAGSDAPTWGYFNHQRGKHPVDLGSAGGNVGLVDGSVAWKAVENMKEYISAASADGGYGNWPAMW